MPGKENRKGNTGKLPKRKAPDKKSSRKTGSSGGTLVSKNTLESLKESQRQLKIVLDAAHTGIWEWNTITNKITWSGSVLEIFRLNQKSFGESFETYLNLVHPDDREKIFTAVQAALDNQKDYHIEHRITWPDGSVRWLEAYGNVFRDKKGNPVKMAGTVQDITSKKAIESEREDWKQRHELVSKSAGLVIYDYDISSGDILWSGNSLEVLGYVPQELGNIDRWVELIHPDDREVALKLLEEAQEKLHPYDVYYRFGMKGGNYCYMHDRGFFIPDSRGKAKRMVGMMNDVSERIRAQESLRDSELRFRTLQQASFGGIGLHDHGVILDCNQGLSDLTGYSYDELMGRNGLELVAPEWRDFVFDKIKSGYGKPYDVEGVRKDGTRYFLEIRGKNVPYQNRTIRVTEFRDITARRRTEEKIIEQNTKLLALTEDLRRKNSQLEEFTQIVSHNLRSPVGNILTLLSFFEGTSSEEEKKEYFTLLKEAGFTTHTMLAELNDVLKIKQNHNIEKQDLRFEQVIHLVKTMLNARIAELSAEVMFDFSGAPTIHYPSIYLESIFLNLLDNALKYHSPERKPKIEFVTYKDDNGHTILEARDNGLGINLERYKHHIFKLRKTFHPHPESRGIGLFMIKNQIEAMGGDISISSQENKGSTFFINFNKHQIDGS